MLYVLRTLSATATALFLLGVVFAIPRWLNLDGHHRCLTDPVSRLRACSDDPSLGDQLRYERALACSGHTPGDVNSCRIAIGARPN